MGVTHHNAVIITYTPGYGTPTEIPEIEEFRRRLPEGWGHLLVGPVSAVANFTESYVFLPDGSKEGWVTSDLGDALRQELMEIADEVYADAVEIGYGGDTPEYTYIRNSPEEL